MPYRRSTPKTMHRAIELRREPTPAEARLWSHLRAHQLDGIQFRRQHAIGPYITDFCAPRQKLIIELDGSPHHRQKEMDTERTSYLESIGYRVLRFWDGDIMDNLGGVLKTIRANVNQFNDRSEKTTPPA